MRIPARRWVLVLSLGLSGSSLALAQAAPADQGDLDSRFKAPSSPAAPAAGSAAPNASSNAATADQTAPEPSAKMTGDDAAGHASGSAPPGVTNGSLSGTGSLSGAGSLSGTGSLSESPVQPDSDRANPQGPAHLFNNGTPLDYGQGGANALGNTGGLSTGPAGSAGEVNAGGGVRSGARVIAPGTMNGAMHDDSDAQRGRSTSSIGQDVQGENPVGTDEAIR